MQILIVFVILESYKTDSKINYTQKKKSIFNAKPNMKKQLARSKIDSKFLNYLALFVRVSIHPYLHAKFLILLSKTLQSFHPNRPESTGILHH